MTRRKPLPEARCPYCPMTFVALTREQLIDTAIAHHEGEHPDVVKRWEVPA